MSAGIPIPLVAEPDDRLVAAPLDGERDPPTSFRELRGVAQQVGEDLREARRVSLEREGLVRKGDVEGQRPRLDRVPARLDRRLQDVGEQDPLAPELHAVARDARDVHQVVDEPLHEAHLPVDDVPCELELRSLRPPQAQDLDGVPDGSEGIPQLVGEGGQELVLAPVGLAQGVLDPFLVRDVHARPDVADELPAVLVAGDSVIEHPPELAVGPAEAVLHRKRPARVEGGPVGRNAAREIVGVDVLRPAVFRAPAPACAPRTRATAC
jgi:hypothetical protein